MFKKGSHVYNSHCDYDCVPQLCALLRGFNAKALKALTSQPNRMARDLKRWYENHIVADRERAEEEATAKRALAKLTRAERDALGIRR